MKKEDLIAMGLSEEQADALVGKYGNMVPLERFNEVNSAKKTLETQVSDYDKQLKDLQDKAKGNDELQAEITKLQEAQQQAKTDFEKQIQEERLTAAVKLTLAGKVHDADLVATLLDKEKIELDDKGGIKGGLEDQLKSLQESKAFLFVSEKQDNQQQNLRGFQPPAAGSEGGQPNTQPKTLGDAVASFFSKSE